MIKTTRRRFLVGCSSAIAAMAGAKLHLTAFGSPEDTNQHTMVILFLRGGMDVLNFMPPIAGDDRGHYETARPDLMVPTSGADAALPLNGQLGLHPSAAPLYELFQDNNLAIVQAAGMHNGTRSHFDAMSYMELGTPDSKTTPNGWITRFLQSSSLANTVLPSLSIASLTPNSLRAFPDTLTFSSASGFNLNTINSAWRPEHRAALRELYGANATRLHLAGTSALDVLNIVEANVASSYTPANGAVYPAGNFGDQLQTIAMMIKQQIGLRVVTIDLGGWDTHNQQGMGTDSYFGNLVGLLSSGLSAFYQDLDGGGNENYAQKTTLVMMSEFGRRFIQNANVGTDHGHGSLMLLLGGQVNGGLYGSWPGLHTDQLFKGRDLAVTTDYRQVLSEVLIRRMGNPNLCAVFPGYTNYSPLGVVQGNDLTPIYDGCESAVPTPLSLTIHHVGNNVVMNWEDLYGTGEGYEVWRSTNPNFLPGDIGSTKLATINNVSYTDTDVLDGNGPNYYYAVRGVNIAGVQQDSPNEVGLFSFDMQPGS